MTAFFMNISDPNPHIVLWTNPGFYFIIEKFVVYIDEDFRNLSSHSAS